MSSDSGRLKECKIGREKTPSYSILSGLLVVLTKLFGQTELYSHALHFPTLVLEVGCRLFSQ